MKQTRYELQHRELARVHGYVIVDHCILRPCARMKLMNDPQDGRLLSTIGDDNALKLFEAGCVLVNGPLSIGVNFCGEGLLLSNLLLV